MLGADAQLGLTEAEARVRLNRYGKNQLTAEKAVPAWRKFLAQFQNVLLLIAAAISAGLWRYERESAMPYEALAIFAVVLLNAVMGLPVAKDALPITEEVGLGDRHNMIFSGTAATYGRGRAVVVATGMQMQMGASPGC